MNLFKMKKFILTIFGYLISLSLLIIIFKDTNFERVFHYLKKIDLIDVRAGRIAWVATWNGENKVYCLIKL